MWLARIEPHPGKPDHDKLIVVRRIGLADGQSARQQGYVRPCCLHPICMRGLLGVLVIRA